MLGSVAACGSDTASGKPAQDKDVTRITRVGLGATLTQVAKDFTKKTGIKVDLKNVGNQHHGIHQLDNAIEAGSGARTSLRLSTTPSRSTPSRATCWTSPTRPPATPTSHPGPWASVQFAGKVYGLPMDSGPMAFFYNNKEVFDKAGVDAEQIKTWDQLLRRRQEDSRSGRQLLHHLRHR